MKTDSKTEMLRQISRQNKLLAREKELRHQRERKYADVTAALKKQVSDLVDEGLKDQQRIVNLQARVADLRSTVEYQEEVIAQLRSRYLDRLWVAITIQAGFWRMAMATQVATFWDRLRVLRLSQDRREAMVDAGLWNPARSRYRAARQYWNHDRKRLRGYNEDVMPGFWRRVLIVLGRA